MTRAEIENMDREYLTPEQVAQILGCGAQGIRIQARNNPDLLGFPVSVIGTRTRIPKIPFIEFLFGKEEAKCN